MKEFIELRERARDKRDKAIALIRTEYEATRVQIAAIEQDLLGRDSSRHNARRNNALAASEGIQIGRKMAVAAADALRRSGPCMCRKALMCCVCYEQDQKRVTLKEGEAFTYYVQYLADKLLKFPAAKAPLDAIRTIGNDANHHVQFVGKSEAERSMNIVRQLFNAIYSFTAA